MNQQQIIYPKVKISYHLLGESDLHISGGGIEQRDVPKRAVNSLKDEKMQVQCFVKGTENRAYIPASTIKGLLASLCSSPKLHEQFFGHSQQMGLLTTYDAYSQVQFLNETDFIRSRVNIDPIRNAAQEHMLYNFNIVPKGTRFSAQILLKNIDRQSLLDFLQLLQQWSGQTDQAIGSNKSTGYGRLKVEGIKVAILTHDMLNNWLKSKEDLSQAFEIDHNILSEIQEKSLTSIFQAYEFSINLLSPLLINDPSQVSEQEKQPNFEYIRDKKGRPIIPGSTLKGALKSQMRKILMTLLNSHGLEINACKEISDAALNDIFGHGKHRSLIRLNDALLPDDISYQLHLQQFSIIDRFSGGNNNLYKANAVGNAMFKGQLLLDKQLDDPDRLWAKQLLLLACKDFEQGDLLLGWGKAKGYGQCELNFEQASFDLLYGHKHELNALKTFIEGELCHA